MRGAIPLSLLPFALASCIASAGGSRPAADEPPGEVADSDPTGRDTSAPVVDLTSPSRGAFLDVADSPTIVVEGTVRDDSGSATLTIDGHRIEVDAQGRFRFEDEDAAPGLRTYTLVATDAAGNLGTAAVSVLRGAFGTGPLPVSLQGRLGPAALDAIAGALQAQLDSLDVDALVRGDGQIAETLRIDAVRHGAITIDLTPGRHGIEVALEATSIEVDLRYSGLWDSDIYVRIERASLGGTLRPGLAGGGVVEVDLEGANATLDGFTFDVSGVGGEDLLEDEVEEALEDALLRLLREQVPPLLENKLASLGRPWTFPIADGAAATAHVSALGADEGGVFLAADVDVAVERSPLAPDSPGSLRSPVATPELEVDGLGAAVSRDLVNALLHASWAAGRLHRTIPLGTEAQPTTVAAVTLLVPALRDVAPSDAPVQLVVEPLLPAVLEATDDGGFALAIGELHLRLEALTADGVVPLATLVARIDAPLAFSLQPEGDLSISIADWTLAAEPLDTRPGLPRGPDLAALLEGVIDMFSVDLAGPIARLPLPAVDGLALDDLQLEEPTDAPGWLLATCRAGAQ